MIPDSAFPVIGWRWWAITSSGRLASPRHGTEWPTRKALRASCDRDHTAPEPTCRCGIHAATPTVDVSYLAQVAAGHTSLVVGSVYLWGRVIPGRWYWRASHAYPASLTLVTKSWQLPDDELKPLQAYGVALSVAAWGDLRRGALDGAGE